MLMQILHYVSSLYVTHIQIHMKIHLEGPHTQENTGLFGFNTSCCDQGEIHFVPVSPKRSGLILHLYGPLSAVVNFNFVIHS